MKRVLFVAALLVATGTKGYAQTGVTGTWRVEGVGIPFPWEVVLRADALSRWRSLKRLSGRGRQSVPALPIPLKKKPSMLPAQDSAHSRNTW
jgi:hypothetical protein